MKKREKGSIIALVIVNMVVLSIIGLAVVYIFGMDAVSANNRVDAAKALYLAESGIEATKAWLVSIHNFPEIHFGTLAGDQTPPISPMWSNTVNMRISPVGDPPNDVNLYNSSACVSGSYYIKSTARVNHPAFYIEKTIVTKVSISTRTWTVSIPSSFTYRSSHKDWDEWPTQRY